MHPLDSALCHTLKKLFRLEKFQTNLEIAFYVLHHISYAVLYTLIASSNQSPECFATGMGQFPICKLKLDLLRTSVTACTIDNSTFSAPFGICYVKMEICK